MTNSFNTVRDYMTMGGRLTDSATLDGVEKLRELWPFLLHESDGIHDEDWNKPLTGFSPMQHRLYFSYEIKAANSNPAVKVYTPVQNYAPNDDAIIENYEKNFRHCGWALGQKSNYKRIVESAL